MRHRTSWFQLVVGLVALGLPLGPTLAQGGAPRNRPTAVAPARVDFDVLPGRWVRADGGYVVTIRSFDFSGRLDASYANPAPLPFAVAQATREGGAVRVFLELRAGGYDGSTYTLTYDPARDALRGVYFQAVSRQKFEVVFTRAK